MNNVRKILVPVNFSDDSATGLKYAASLAEDTKAELVVLHVTQKEQAQSFLNCLAVMEGWPTPSTPIFIPLDRLVREKALDLYRFIERVLRNSNQLKIKRKVVLGLEDEKIVGVAREENIDLVVLGVRNESFFVNLLARAKFVKIMARLPCPVLLKPGFGKI